MKLKKIIYAQQRDGFCGPAVLRTILASYGIEKSERELGKLTDCSVQNGTSAENIVRAAKTFGFDSSIKDNNCWEELYYQVKDGPVIINWFAYNTGHYSAVFEVYKNDLVIADPEYGFTKPMKKNEFLPVWFDFNGTYPKTKKDFILRRMIVFLPPKNLNLLEKISRR